MSTGHCSTHAPQVVHDHNTSGSMTPTPASATRSPSVETPASEVYAVSGDSAAYPVSPMRGISDQSGEPSGALSPAATARRKGALALLCSRSDIMSSLGESGLSVFHAGHCDWQRPHSVQVVKSSRPFQVKSSALPTPRTGGSASSSSSAIASIASSVKGSPRSVIGLTAPSAVRPEASRLNQMFGKARKRCQATPIVGLSEMVIIHAKDTRILNIAIA